MAKSITITIKENSRSVENCTTNVTVTCKITTSGESYRGDHNTGTCTIDGTSYSFTHGAPANSTTTLFTKTLNIAHNTTTGQKTLTVSCNYSSGWCTASKSQALTTIDRYPNAPSISAPSTGIISETSKSITVKWSTTNRGTYTLEVSKNGSAWSTVASGIAIGTLSYTYSFTPSQGDTYSFRVKAVYSGLSSSYSTSGTVTINKLNAPTVGDIATYNPYTGNLTINVSGGSQSNGGTFNRNCHIYYDWGGSASKGIGTCPSVASTSTTLTFTPNDGIRELILSVLGTTSYSNSNFYAVCWIENSNGSRSSYITKKFTININSDGGATPTLGSVTIGGGMLNNTSTCFVNGISDLVVTLGNATTRRAPSGTTISYKVECTGMTAKTGQSCTFSKPSAGVKTITITATDSRGLSTKTTKEVRFQSWMKPTVTITKAERNATTSTTIDITYTVSYSPIYAYSSGVNTQGTQLNGISVQQYSVNTGSYTNCTSPLSITGYSESLGYTINIRCSDKVSTSTYGTDSKYVTTALKYVAMRQWGIGLNCIPQNGYRLDVNGTVRIGGVEGYTTITDGEISASSFNGMHVTKIALNTSSLNTITITCGTHTGGIVFGDYNNNESCFTFAYNSGTKLSGSGSITASNGTIIITATPWSYYTVLSTGPITYTVS